MQRKMYFSLVFRSLNRIFAIGDGELAHARQSMRASLPSLNRNFVKVLTKLLYEKVLFITAKRYGDFFL